MNGGEMPAGQEIGARFRRYQPLILGLLAVATLGRAYRFSVAAQADGPARLVDFDMFHLVARLVWAGRLEEAYRFDSLWPLLHARGGLDFMTWAYPPPFDLVVAPLGLLPAGAAYLVFVGGTLALYLFALKRLAGEDFALVAILIFPAFAIGISGGQNGFLTGALIALACLGFERRRWQAGVPLGLMIIKPHLAAGLAVRTLLARRFAAAVAAALTVVAACLAATVCFGAGIWAVFLEATRETGIFLKEGFFPLHRMVSIYATARSFGLGVAPSFAAQGLVALVALAAIVRVTFGAFTLRQSLGVTAIASLLLSPYAYDYDLSLLGVGLALLLPDLMGKAGKGAIGALFSLCFITCGYWLVEAVPQLLAPEGARDVAGEVTKPDTLPALAGLTLLALFALIWWLTERSAGMAARGAASRAAAAAENSAAGAKA
ncbi:glycosyltransferase family 87 protein [Afifella marina]|uniref:DUF2029 domain-containing protein n=1 Tax=Afifella marina DSM 2698 TaxID=1120955 RepID=A0A1G5NQ25_AFIMA|nr:glycosyltransferase family 87 protein [Afifella marina]MBK1624526.1 DUF2029 domain-containing protein [Afifella marina DSM 2698]MBK1627419.1 DUF2029 domain-containing protein [Afifella marina]MBK5918477.1 hypothetical protein [Afifella marina]RAI20634.1 hypothetical protein CH311_09625 [Afifella marina DSM 2698]SCZ39244.1 Protein of unknown function [Afifella marina DSM 2698]